MTAKVGTGLDALLTKRLLPGAQHPDIPGLWINYGRLQMVSSFLADVKAIVGARWL